MKTVGVALGLVISFTDAPEGRECANCAKEASKKEDES